MTNIVRHKGLDRNDASTEDGKIMTWRLHGWALGATYEIDCGKVPCTNAIEVQVDEDAGSRLVFMCRCPVTGKGVGMVYPVTVEVG